MEIAVRLDGGLGDCLLGNRFVSAIKEKYTDANVTAYIDSEGKTFQKECLDTLYASMYKDIKVIPNKKYKEFWVDCQFGTDNYYGALENVPDTIRSEMDSYDKFYDLHIDSLKWTNYDFDWLRYYRFFPRPELSVDNVYGDYIVLHMISSTSKGHLLDHNYINNLVAGLMQNHKVFLISTPETNHFYNQAVNMYGAQLFNGSVKEVCELISNAKFMLSTDSGFRYIAYGYGIPTLTYSSHSNQPFSSIPSHQMRWLMYPETCFPLNYNYEHMINIIDNIISDNGYILAPYLQDFNMQAVRRVYTINKDRTK